MSRSTQIIFLNESTVLTDDQARAIIAALRVQVHRDFSPCWGTDADLIFMSAEGLKKLQNLGQNAAQLYPKAWQMVLLDNSNEAGALGYHMATDAGQPIGFVGCKTDLDYGYQASVTISHELCLAGDTKIPLLDGTEATIAELVGREHFWVYSCNEKGEIRPGRGHSARLTKANEPVIKVTLDNGEVIRCTSNHPFMMRNGEYVQAGSLKPGDSLMPLYRRLEKISALPKAKDYEQVYVPGADKWKFTHRVVVPYCSSGYVRHHQDFNRFNNSPDNLTVMKWDDHRKLHAEHIVYHLKEFLASGKKRKESPEGKAARRYNGRSQVMKYNGSARHREDMARYYDRPGTRQKHGARLREYASSPENVERVTAMARTPERREKARQKMITYNKSEQHREIARQLGTDMFAKFWSDPEFIKRHKERSSARANTPEWKAFSSANAKLQMHRRWHIERNKPNPKCELCVNHKVVSIESGGRSDVYDLTVDGYHNFAVASGVFVHNCEMLADPWIVNTVFVQATDSSGRLWCLEVADPCEDDHCGYKIGDILVSDFVTPAYFQPELNPRQTLDFCGHITVPLTLVNGGYLSYFDIPNTGGWSQLNADKVPDYKLVAPKGSRRWRRANRETR